jgi:integrase
VSRSSRTVPSYRRHKQSGQAIVTIRLPNGKRKDMLLGPWKSPESRREYARIIAELQAGQVTTSFTDSKLPSELTIDEALVPFLKHCDQYYRHPNGEPTGQAQTIRDALRPLSQSYGHTPMADFGPIGLKAVRQGWVNRGLVRKTCNIYTGLVRQFFRWAVAEQLIPSSVLEGLKAVEALKVGRTQAHDRPPIQPADEKIIAAALPFLPPTVTVLVKIQTLCGARGGELVIMKPAHVDRSGKVWVYTPESHKNAYRGKQRHIYFGPQCQEILKPWLDRVQPDQYVFSPLNAESERNAVRSARRVTPRYPSHMKRNKAKRKRRPLRSRQDHYTKDSYNRAVARACEKSFPLPKHLAKSRGESNQAWKTRLGEKGLAEVQVWREKHSFSPHQLRHLAATKIRKEYGIELSRILLGHSDIGTTQIYAEVDAQKAMDAASKIG